jgi:predicted dinucleotide-binding enzyme
MSATIKKIGILGGSGGVGKTLAVGFVKAGYEVLNKINK